MTSKSPEKVPPPPQPLRRTSGSRISILSSSSLAAEHPRTVGAFGLALLTFFNVSGGPWGSEPVVSSAGPFYGFISLFAAALCWGLPLCLVTSELCSALPNNGGYVLWVDTAFGGFWGFQESFWSWGSCVVDNALYPVLAYETFVAMYLGDITGPLDVDVIENMHSWYFAYACKFFLTILFSLPVLVGKTDWITKGMAVMGLLVTLPFAILLPYMAWTRPLDWTQIWAVRTVGKNSKTGIDWVELLHITFWNFNGFDCASTCAGEVKDPGRSYPLGLLSALVVTVLMVLIPLLLATAANTPDWHMWDVGWWSAIANENAGRGFAWAVVLSSLVGTFGMHSAVMWEDSWQLCGMAEQGLAPRWLAKRNEKLGTPENATLVSMLMVCLLIMFDFRSMVIIDNFFSMASGLLELAAFVHLKRTRSDLDLPRPFRVPFVNSDLTLFIFMLPPITVGVAIITTSFDDGWTSVLTLLPVMLLGLLLPVIFGRNKPMTKIGGLMPRRQSSVQQQPGAVSPRMYGRRVSSSGDLTKYATSHVDNLAHTFDALAPSVATAAGGLYGALIMDAAALAQDSASQQLQEEEALEEEEEMALEEEEEEGRIFQHHHPAHFDSIFTPPEVLEDHVAAAAAQSSERSLFSPSRGTVEEDLEQGQQSSSQEEEELLLD